MMGAGFGCIQKVNFSFLPVAGDKGGAGLARFAKLWVVESEKDGLNVSTAAWSGLPLSGEIAGVLCKKRRRHIEPRNRHPSRCD